MLKSTTCHFRSRLGNSIFLQSRSIHGSIRRFGSHQMAQQPTIVISGPSGVGKSTIIRYLDQDKDIPYKFATSTSHTTRAPRPGEQNGREYHFVTAESFNKLVDEGAFIEHAKFSDKQYGTTFGAVKDVAEQGKVCILDIEMEVCHVAGHMLRKILFQRDSSGRAVQLLLPRAYAEMRGFQGVKSIRSHPTAKLNEHVLFLQPPSVDDLEKRLRGRGDTSEEQIQKRLMQARKEMEFARTPGVVTDRDMIIVNEDLDMAYGKVKAWVLKVLS